jgi:general secretion pathway protein A
MYKALYKLESKPFEIQPDPSVLWLGGKHKEALSVLRYGILDNMGFVLLVGDAGTGKTTMVNALTGELKSDVVWAVISDPTLDRIGFFNKIGTGFGIGNQFISKVQFLIQFSHFLHKAHDTDKKVVLFVDNCHLLSQDLFEELHLLSNIEKTDAKLIDIFFIGQPEFVEMLVQPKNKAVRQRLGLKAKLVPFENNETEEYIKHRLKISGAVEKIFTAMAFQVIHQYSEGVPRVINVICEEALQAGFLQDKKIIDHKQILECVQKLKMPPRPELSNLILPSVEKIHVEGSRDKFVPRDVDHQVAPARSVVGKGKQKVWGLSILSVLVCIGLGLYLFLPKKEIPVVAEIGSIVVAQDAPVATLPKVAPTPVVAVLQKDNETLPDVQNETELKVNQPSTGRIESGQVSRTAEREEKMLETEQPAVENVVPVVETEPEISSVLVPLEPTKIVLGLQPGTVALTVDADRVFVEFLEILLQYPDARVVVKGFVSSNNDSPENTQLSEERAANVQRLLIKSGIAETQIEVRGMGIQDPIATNDTPTGRLKNRRVEIEVIDDGV